MNENEVSKWQLWLLAHLPRPLVVLLMMPAHLVTSVHKWLRHGDGQNLIHAIIVIYLSIWGGAGFLIGLTNSLQHGAIVMVAGIFAGMVSIGVFAIAFALIDVIRLWYSSVDKSLPRREKKDEE